MLIAKIPRRHVPRGIFYAFTMYIRKVLPNLELSYLATKKDGKYCLTHFQNKKEVSHFK